jgi:hypothetical protein
MRTPTLGTAFYAPSEPPSDPKELQNYLREEFIKISAAVTALSLGHLDNTTVAPPKPREGDIRLCSGVGGWDPLGTGQKFVGFRGGAWVLLG